MPVHCAGTGVTEASSSQGKAGHPATVDGRARADYRDLDPWLTPHGKRIGLILLLAAGYMASGGLGLELAAPPGYATIIWPASGLAVGALLMYGPGLWPGILIGSFLLNAHVGNAYGAAGWDEKALLVALSIAAGSTLQAYLATRLLRRLFGVPTALNGPRDALLFAAIVGPICCVIAATVGVATLLLGGVVPARAAAATWATWWTGDLIGIAVFLPIALFSPWRPWSVKWSGNPLAGLTAASVLALLIPLGLTLYAWKWTSETTFERNKAAFESLVDDNQKALRHRLDSYLQALDGASGFLEASGHISLTEWRTYVEALEIGRTLPGINGIGFISAVEPDKVAEFLKAARADGVIDMHIRPQTPAPALFIIRYIEPVGKNAAAVGLNIAFEQNRYAAAVHARDSGLPTITRRIFLVQDATKSAGFLLLRPLYRAGVPTTTLKQRRAAFLGWVYAPFVGNGFMENLTGSQGRDIAIDIFDGAEANGDKVIYSAADPDVRARKAHYVVQRTLPIMEQEWTIVWSSTPEFEAGVSTKEAWLVLVGGILLSMLLGVYLLAFARREEEIRLTVVRKTHEIAAREQLNRSIVNTAIVAILLLDEEGTVLSANRAAEQIFGHSDTDMVGSSVGKLLGFDRGERARGLLRRLSSIQRGHVKYDGGMVARKKDGTPLQLDVQLNSWVTEGGQIRFTAIVRDVTEQRNMTIALEQAEERWNLALRGANIGVFDVDLIKGSSVVSDTWCTMLGFHGDAPANPQAEWRSRVHPEDLPKVLEADRDCFEGRTARTQSQYRIRRKDGAWRWLSSEATVTERDRDGKALRLVGTQMDITDLKDTQAALEASKERLHSAIENAPIGMALVDPEGKWLKVNEALCRFLGYSEAEFGGIDFSKIVHPDDIGTDAEMIEQLVTGEIATYQLERRYLHRDGHTLWGLLCVSLARNPDGSIAHFISQIQDISHRREMDRMKSEFISNVSHELRTPLTSIRGSLGLITGTMSKGIPDGVMRLLTIAHKNSERLILLINDILDIEKLSADKTRYDLVDRDICHEVRQAIDANQGYADHFGVTFEADCIEGLAIARIDSARYQQILANLLSNAAKFSPAGGTVGVSVCRVDGRVRTSVSDKGPGIPSAFRRLIFTPFSQADASATRVKGGTGLGLHISKQMIERMGGTIGFHSVVGEGSTFWMDLPDPASGQGDASPLATPALPDSGLPTVLHVEDDVDFFAFLATALRGKANLLNARSLSEARSQMQHMEADLVILDLNLPDGRGLSLLDEMPAGEEKPVIVLTATEFSSGDPRIRQVITKSRTPEHMIVEAVLSAVQQSGTPAGVAVGSAIAS